GVVAPVSGGRGGGDGDTTRLLLLHPVHGGGALMDLTDLVIDTGVEQDPLGRGGFARVDMRHDPDVPDTGEVRDGLGGHYCDPYVLSCCRALTVRHLNASPASRPAATSGSARKPCWIQP